MSDRLKFRVWDNVEKKYLDCDDDYIDYAITRDGILILIANDNSDCRHIYLDKDRYIIEQCTGLKDKNGKLIFEGDVVIYEVFVSDWSDEKRKGYGIVYYDDDQHAFGVKTIRQTVTSSFGLNKLISEIEVISNIHENPEFLNANNA